MVIRQLSPNITIFTVPFERAGVIKFGGRATSVKLDNGGLVVFSPVGLTEEVKSELSRQGKGVSYLVAPDIEHHMHLSAWKEAFPQAKIIAPEGLREKRASQNPKGDIPFDYIITSSPSTTAKLPSEITQEFLVEYFHSHANKELAFLYKRERTLITADLLFNMPAFEAYKNTGVNPTSGIATKLFNHLIGSAKGEAKGQQRFLWWAAAAKDRNAFSESAKRVQAWDFERIIPCHGEVIESGGKGVYEKIYKWFL